MGKQSSGTSAKKKQYVSKMKKMGSAVIGKDLAQDILYCLSKRPNLEWSGLLFWKINEEADLEDPETIEIEVEHMHLQDLGSGTYTDFSNDGGELIDLYDGKPELMEMRCGLIHSHHTMKAFFSGTDTEELHEKAENGLYFSLIVNNHMEPVAKLCWMTTAEEEVKKTQTHNAWEFGNYFRRESKQSVETETIQAEIFHEMEFEINWPLEMTAIADRYKELDKSSIVAEANALNKRYGIGGNTSVGYGANQGFGNSGASYRNMSVPSKTIPNASQRGKQLGFGFMGHEPLTNPSTDGDEDEATFWDIVKAHKREGELFASIAAGETTRLTLREVILTQDKAIRAKTLRAVTTGETPAYTDLLDEYFDDAVEEIVAEGQMIAAECVGDFYITEEHYAEALFYFSEELESHKIECTFARKLKEGVDEYVAEIQDTIEEEQEDIVDQINATK